MRGPHTGPVNFGRVLSHDVILPSNVAASITTTIMMFIYACLFHKVFFTNRRLSLYIGLLDVNITIAVFAGWIYPSRSVQLAAILEGSMTSQKTLYSLKKSTRPWVSQPTKVFVSIMRCPRSQ